jgi:hypothetical protein
MFKGIGDPWVRTTAFSGTAANDQKMLVLGLLSFELTSESTSKESQKFNSSGELVTATTVKGSTSYTFTLSYNEIDWGNLGFALNQFPRTASSVPIPTLKYGTVPTSPAYTIADTSVVTANLTSMSVVITQSGAWGQAGQTLTVAGGAPSAGQVQLANNLLTFNAAQAGAPVAYTAFATATSVQDLGGPSGASLWGEFEFWGTIFIPSLSQGTKIHIPKATISEDPTITIDDAVPTVSVVCGLSTPSGWNKPFRILNLNTLT